MSHRSPDHNFAIRRGGFTILELLVVGVLGTIVIGFIASSWKWYAHGAADVHINVQLAKELKIAAETLADDYGPALATRTLDGTTIQFDHDTDNDGTAQWDAPDTVIEYSLVGQMLKRHNLATDTIIPMSAHITAFETTSVAGQLQIHLVAGYRDSQQDVTLELRPPSP